MHEQIHPAQDFSPKKNGSAWPMTVLTSLFFLWGFITVLNDVLVPHWKTLFDLSYAESLLVQLCFFGAYFFGSLLYWWLSISSGDPISRIGYKRGMIIGLVLAATGCALFVPASMLHSYPAHLGALFVLGLGFTLLQIAANPFVALVGDPGGASSRLNMAQAFNSLGTTLAPLIGGWLIFQNAAPDAAVRLPYLGLSAILLLIAALLWFTPLPEPARVQQSGSSDALRHPHLRWGMVAIFCYVGAEVAVGSLIINFSGLPDVMGLTEGSAKHYLSLYWGGAMVGRFLGAMALAKNAVNSTRYVKMILFGITLFGSLYLLNNIDSRFLFADYWPMGALIAANMAAFMFIGPDPRKALGLFAVIACCLLAGVIMLHGPLALWAMVAIGLFNSIMWSNIFTLAIDGLGDDTAQGSSLLVMMIVGGALIPPIQGAIIDFGKQRGELSFGFHWSYLLPLACYAYLAWYGFRGSQRNNA
jgi:MFS transporter, FHS family, L-fucose permease